MALALNRTTIIVLAIKLVQPGRLADIVEGVTRLLPNAPDYAALKSGVRKEIQILREAELVQLYEGQRYILTRRGEQLATETGIGHSIEARRMFLLKETRKGRPDRRSSTRVRSLLQ